MAIFRVVKDENSSYVMLNKEFINDKDLSLKAKGLLTYLLSLPNDWKIYEKEIVKHSKDGKDSIKTAIKELINNGYIKRELSRDKLGKIQGYDYNVYEKSIQSGKPVDGKPVNGKPATTNNNLTKEELNYSIVEQVINYMNELAGTNYKSTTTKTRTLINARLKEGFTLDDMLDVVFYKHLKWYKHPITFTNGVSSDTYFRPKTLFNNNFESYLQEYKKYCVNIK